MEWIYATKAILNHDFVLAIQINPAKCIVILLTFIYISDEHVYL